MKKTTKLLCLLLSVSLILSCLPAMGISAAIGANGSYCDFDNIPLREVGETSVDSSYFANDGLAFADTTGGISVEDKDGDGNRGLHLYSSASVGVALPTAVSGGKVKATLSIYPMACATYVYLASSMGSSLATSTAVAVGKFGSSFAIIDNANATVATSAMSWAKYNRIELIADLDNGTLDGYLNGTHIGQLTGLNPESIAGVIVGGNATLENKVTNKPLIGDLGISTYTENDTFSYVGSKDSALDNVHTTTVMFDEPVKASTLEASNVTITPCTGGEAIAATSASAYGPAVTLTWSGEMSVGTEYRIDFGSSLRSTYNRPLDDAAYLIKTSSILTKTLIDEDFDDLDTKDLNVATGFNTKTGIYLLGGDNNTVKSDVAQPAENADALRFSFSTTTAGYLKMPRSDAAYPYSASDPYTAADGNYAAVPYQTCSTTASQNKFYRLGDLTKTELGGMPKSGIITWSFDYMWEHGSGTTATNYYLKWGGDTITGWCSNDYVLNKLIYNANDTNSWNSIVVEYDASNGKIRYGTNSDDLCKWKTQDMSDCDWLVLPVELSVQRLAFAVDNVKVTYTGTPLYVEGIRYVASDGSVTGSPSIQSETEKINIYFSEAVNNDIASHITINGSAISDYTLSSDGKMMTVNTAFFKAGSTVTLAIDASAASAAGSKIAEAKTYTLTTGSGRFAVENLNATVNAATPGIITSGDEVNVTGDIINTSDEYDSCILIFAYYTDGGNTLVDVGIHNVDLTDTYLKHEDYDFAPTAFGKAYDTVKVFAWNSLTEAMPLVTNLIK